MLLVTVFLFDMSYSLVYTPSKPFAELSTGKDPEPIGVKPAKIEKSVVLVVDLKNNDLHLTSNS